MRMHLGERLRIHLWGETHGSAVGVLVEGMPPGLEIDRERLARHMARRRPGGAHASARQEADTVHLDSGVVGDVTTGGPLLVRIPNQDAKSRDYDFLPDHPRPGHADLPQHVRSAGHADLRGGGVHSARLTAGLVAAAAIITPLTEAWGWGFPCHLAGVEDVSAAPLRQLLSDPAISAALDDDQPSRGDRSPASWLPTLDDDAMPAMLAALAAARADRDSVGSRVALRITGLPLGLGEPWFDGLLAALGGALLALPATRAVEFDRGAAASTMRGSAHNDPWVLDGDRPLPSGREADGSLGGLATGAPLDVLVHLKPPSSLPRPQTTLHLPSGTQRPLEVKGRHDPVLGPRAVPVVQATARLVLADLGLRFGLPATLDD